MRRRPPRARKDFVFLFPVPREEHAERPFDMRPRFKIPEIPAAAASSSSSSSSSSMAASSGGVYVSVSVSVSVPVCLSVCLSVSL